MHPAFSVIFFTTASGAGYGLLALLGAGNALGLVPAAGWFGFWSLGLALILIAGGLLASTAHLGHPERAWRAVSQVGTSWLSREGVAALATFIPFAVFGIAWVFFGLTEGVWALPGLIAALGAAVTVFATAMIYRSLKPIHQWHNFHVVPVYLTLSLATGALLLHALVQLWGHAQPVIGVVALLATALAGWAKQRYWNFVDTTKAPSSPETATGLGAIGKVRLLESPHQVDNYLMREMGFQVARKHALKLRRIALSSLFAVPLILTLLALLAPGPGAAIMAVLAALSAGLGVGVERWLFFAEAKHTVTLYYGATDV
jgi:sulfite dehydrogenase (quinone) subunit SoeC